MGSDTPESQLVNASQKASDYDEVFMQHKLQFADSLKDLKNLREQLYSAAEYFESSYDKDGHKQFVVESSKNYVAKALVSTVDHLGSVAHKLNKFLDKNANEFSATRTQFSCIEQRLSTFQGFINFRGLSQHLLIVEPPTHHKHYIFPASKKFPGLGKSKEFYGNCVPCPPHDVQQPKQDNSFSKYFQVVRRKPDSPQVRKEQFSKMPSREPFPNRPSFSFTKVVPNKEPGPRSISPLRFPLKRSGTIANRSISPSPSDNKPRWQSEPRRAISAFRRLDATNREREIESYTRRSMDLFKALISVHRSKKVVNAK